MYMYIHTHVLSIPECFVPGQTQDTMVPGTLWLHEGQTTCRGQFVPVICEKQGWIKTYDKPYLGDEHPNIYLLTGCTILGFTKVLGFDPQPIHWLMHETSDDLCSSWSLPGFRRQDFRRKLIQAGRLQPRCGSGSIFFRPKKDGTKNLSNIWRFPKMGVPLKSSILIGFSIIKL